MSRSFRVLSTALLVIALAAAAAVFISYRWGPHARQSVLEVATTGDLRDLFGSNEPEDSMLVNIALRKLESDFYKPIDPQTPLAGESAGLRTLLNAKRVDSAALPGATAQGDPLLDGERAGNLLAFAQQHYATDVGPSGREDLTDAALRGIMNSVHDPYTVYLSPREIQGLNESLSGGNFGGIGVYIGQLKDGRIVLQPIESLPAARAGMKPGEIVDTVDGKSVRGMSIDRVEELIRGEVGTAVHVRGHAYTAPSGEQTFTIVREIIHVPTVHAKMEHGVDYIRLSEFGTTSADEIHKALLEGKAHGARGYILDLRYNGGGRVDAAVQISSFFIPQGKIVSTITRDGRQTDQVALGDDIGGLRPLVVLVNKYTASASEITAGALQDYRLATLIGTRTYGKGVVQTIFNMPNDGALKITTARYLTPAGRDIQHHGIEPDIFIDQDANPALIDTPADKQLAAAKARLQTAIR
jgi:carboxyl-terminal processing protease